MRLFIAIDCQSEKEHFQKLQSSIPTDSGRIKKIDSFHLTLKFLGKVPESKLKEVIEKLKTVRFKRFSFNHDKIGFFPNNNYIRVIWQGIKPEKEVIDLNKKIEDSLKGLFKGNFDFKPHITLARVKNIIDRKNFFEKIEKIKCEDVKVDVKEFKLIKSTLTQNGPVYEELEVFLCSAE